MDNVKIRKNHKAWLAVLALSLAMIVLGFGLTNAYGLTGVADGKVYNVTNAMTEYDTIQAAIDGASTGDTLVAGPGTYNESVVVNVENLTLKSNVGAATTLITGGSSAVLVEVDQFTLEGFTLSSSEWALTIQAMANGDLAVSDCVFNDAMYGILFGTVTDSSVTLTGNDMPTTYRGAYFEQAVTGSTITVNDNTFTDLKAEGGVFFGQTIADSTVDITDNIFTNCYNGIQANGEIEDTQMTISGNEVTGGYNAVYFYNGGEGLCGTSVLTVEENTFTDLSEDGVYVYYIERGGEARINNNTISDSDTGIYVEYVGYDYEDNPANLYIEGNDITDCYYGIEVDGVYYGSAIIEANNIHNAGYPIYMDHTADASVETDVQIIDNCITADDDNVGLYDAIYICCVDAVTTISGNEISGNGVGNYYDTGIYLEDIGCCGADLAMLEVSDNQIKFVEYGILMEDTACCTDAEVLVEGNVISEADYGLYLEYMSSEMATVDVIGNTIRDCDTGIYVYDMYGETDEEVYLTINWNVITENEVGIYLNEVSLYQEEPGVWISSNDITNNGTGLEFGYIPDADSDLIVVSFNNFSGNTDYAINMLGGSNDAAAPSKAPAKAPSPESFILQAELNWWGDATGPKYSDNDAMGDEINGWVDSDPWIQKLVITPKTSTGFEGKPRSFTATLYDSNGDVVDAPLAVQFVVKGANKAQGIVNLVNGVATFTYTGNNPGTDAVDVGLIFVEEPVEEFALTAEAIWTAAQDEGNPDTGDQSSNWYIYTLVISLLLGLGLVRFRSAATMRK